jgi:hypothetical protein
LVFQDGARGAEVAVALHPVAEDQAVAKLVRRSGVSGMNGVTRERDTRAVNLCEQRHLKFRVAWRVANLELKLFPLELFAVVK